MFEISRLVVFILASIGLLLIPGPAVLFIIARSMHQGRKAGVVSVLGLEVGSLMQVAAAAAGITAIVLSSALAFNIVKYLGAAYLIYMGIRKLRERDDITDVAQFQPTSLPRLFFQGIMVNMLNPKTALFFLAFLPQFVDPAKGNLALQTAILGLIFVGLGTATDSGYALLAGTIGQWLRRSARLLKGQRYFAGTMFIGLGLSAALTTQST